MPRGQELKKIKIDFTSVKDMTLGDLYGTQPIPVTELTKRIWALIKSKDLRVDKKK